MERDSPLGAGGGTSAMNRLRIPLWEWGALVAGRQSPVANAFSILPLYDHVLAHEIVDGSDTVHVKVYVG